MEHFFYIYIKNQGHINLKIKFEMKWMKIKKADVVIIRNLIFIKLLLTLYVQIEFQITNQAVVSEHNINFITIMKIAIYIYI